MSVHETNASSPSKNSICTPLLTVSSNKSCSIPAACAAAHFCVRASSILRATCMSIAHGAALSVAPIKPSGDILLS